VTSTNGEKDNKKQQKKLTNDIHDECTRFFTHILCQQFALIVQAQHFSNFPSTSGAQSVIHIDQLLLGATLFFARELLSYHHTFISPSACFYLDYRDTRLRLKHKRSPLHSIQFSFSFIMQASALEILIADGVGNKQTRKQG
jgi:hypothetical protein